MSTARVGACARVGSPMSDVGLDSAKPGDFSIGSRVWPGLSKLIEEAGEVLQVAGKLIAIRGAEEHYDGSNLRRRIEDEIADLDAAVRFFIEANGLDAPAIAERSDRKLQISRSWQTEHGDRNES